jgi:hypothetical protein
MSSPFQKKGESPEESSDSAVFSQIMGGENATKALAIQSEVQDRLQKKQLESMGQISNFDWKSVPPPMLAQMLVNIPFKGGVGEPDYFLAPWQAMIFAMRCFELGLSPFSNEVWFNPKNNKTNITFEGKLKLARLQGLNLSPPHLERIPADSTKPLQAYKCTIRTPSGNCEYTATLKDWNQPRSPVWREKPDHMLQLRAAEKCLSFASGIGSSELMGEPDLQEGAEVAKIMPQVDVTNFEYKEQMEKP